MKRVLLFLILLIPAMVLAADAIDPATAPLPTTTTDYWMWAISLVTPVIVWGTSKIEAIPTSLLPVLTPFIGIALGLGLNALAKANLGWVDMAQAGALAVFIREVVNQQVTKRLASPASGK